MTNQPKQKTAINIRLLPDNVNSAIDYLEYLMVINKIDTEMKGAFRSGFKAILNELADKAEYGLSNFNRESVINKILTHD